MSKERMPKHKSLEDKDCTGGFATRHDTYIECGKCGLEIGVQSAAEVKESLVSILGEHSVDDSLVQRVLEKMVSEDPTGDLTYSGSKLGNCYYGYSSIVFGDCVMPGGNGGPAGAKQDLYDAVLGRVRTCYYTVDSSG